MNIALFNDSFPPTIDGVANAVSNYADILTAKHCTATVVTPEYPNIVDNYPYEVYRYSSLKFRGEMPYRVGNPFSPKTIRDLVKKDFDILHVHCPFASAVLAHEVNIAHITKRVPTVLTYHTKFDIDIDNYVKNKRINKISKKFILGSINYADEVWCVSSGAVESLYSLGYTGEAIVMENGTDFKKGRADSEAVSEIKRMYKLDDSVPTFLYCGRTMWYKNIQIILDGLKLLIAAGYKFKAIFVGDGPDRPGIEAYAKQIGLNNDLLLFTGAIYDREKLRAFYSIADLLMFPSTYDTSGLVVKEAAACACPAVLVENSCAAEGVIDMKNGLLIKENAESFAEKIAIALKTDNLLKNIGKDAENSVYLSWEDSVERAYNRYCKIIENYGKKAE